MATNSNSTGKISVYIIAYNQEDKIEPALKSVQWADEIVVADSFSTDKTAMIAQQYGARVVQIPFKGFGDLRNRAIDACSHCWIFSLDSDERCTPEAENEILSIINSASSGKESSSLHDLYYVPRKNFFMGRWIQHSGYYPDYRQPQLFRKGTLVFRPDAVHESYEIFSRTEAGYIKSPIHQIPYKNLEEMVAKKNRYSTLGAEKIILARECQKVAGEDKKGAGEFTTQKSVEIKEISASMSSALMHALWAFIRTYLIKLGFLDGWPGFVIALGNFEETFYKYAKLYVKVHGLDS